MSEFMWIPGSQAIKMIIITDAELTFFLNMEINPSNDFLTWQRKSLI